MMHDERQREEDANSRPPLLAVEPPSQERVPQTNVSVPGPSRRDMWFDVANRPIATMVQSAQKDADDPTVESAGLHRQETPTTTTLSRLFAAQIPLSPEGSRSSSYVQPNKPYSGYARNMLDAGTAALPDHLYTRGLLEGRHSDITVNAFGQQYRLHRLILDRAPFFRSALSEPWLESSARETTVHPEDIDTSITKRSFELALKRLYGCPDAREEDGSAVGLFATACWLEMQDLIEHSVDSILRHMGPGTLSSLIKLVTSNYYGRAGDKILASAKAMLCRDGYRMRLRYWDGIPGDIVREIVGGDGFFIDSEWERWVLAKRILDRRLRKAAIEAGLVDSADRKRLQKMPQTSNVMAIRFDGVYRRNGAGSGHGLPDHLQQWVALYTHPDVEPLLVLLDEGIHYVHLDFEQLQLIRKARDVVGLPVMPEKVISNALWQQMELRQKVMNTAESELELGISTRSPPEQIAAAQTAHHDATMNVGSPTSPPPLDKGKQKASERTDVPEDGFEEDIDSDSWDGNAKPRKFWIPSSDCNIVMGGNADPLVQTSNTTTIQRHASRYSATIEPQDVQWASDFAAATAQPRPQSAGGPGQGPGSSGEVRFSHYPPFRFAAEFPNPRLLKEKKRVYSRTVFYAGSLWNIYIQKVASTRRKQQLGVYLHRAKERETEKVIQGTAGVAQGSVDERIGQLEREMILRSERRERNQARRADDGTGAADGADSSGSANEFDFGTEPPYNGNPGDAVGEAAMARANTLRNLLSRNSTGLGGQGGGYPPESASFHADSTTHSDSEADDDAAELLRASQKAHVPTLPPYVDARPTIKTYFKIYSPSRQGRMLSVYESAPDTFNFSQSWGWMSSTLMVDEGIMDDADEGAVPGSSEGEGPGGISGAGKVSDGLGVKGKGDGKLRFMVVIGNV